MRASRAGIVHAHRGQPVLERRRGRNARAGRDRRRRCGGRWCRGRRHRRARDRARRGGRARRRGRGRGIAPVAGTGDRDHDAQSDQHERRGRHPPPTLARRPRDRSRVGYAGPWSRRWRPVRRDGGTSGGRLGATSVRPSSTRAHRAGRREAVGGSLRHGSRHHVREIGGHGRSATARTSGTADCWWAIAMASADSPSNGGRPASIS